MAYQNQKMIARFKTNSLLLSLIVVILVFYKDRILTFQNSITDSFNQNQNVFIGYKKVQKKVSVFRFLSLKNNKSYLSQLLVVFQPFLKAGFS